MGSFREVVDTPSILLKIGTPASNMELHMIMFHHHLFVFGAIVGKLMGSTHNKHLLLLEVDFNVLEEVQSEALIVSAVVTMCITHPLALCPPNDNV